jgi:hypothetical protein
LCKLETILLVCPREIAYLGYIPKYTIITKLDKLNLIKHINRNKFDNYNYWQLLRRFPIVLKINIFNNLKKLLIDDFKIILTRHRYFKKILF